MSDSPEPGSSAEPLTTVSDDEQAGHEAPEEAAGNAADPSGEAVDDAQRSTVESAPASELEPPSDPAPRFDPEPATDPELTTEQVVEAVLFAADAPLPLSRIVSIVGVGTARDVRKHIESLNAKYEASGSAFRIDNIAGGYQMLSLPRYNTWVRRLKQSRQDTRLSQAALETLAVVAYRQPVVRADIEAIRGVSSGEMLNRLRELGLLKIVGRADDVGRPMLYGTTRKFLELFGLSGLDDLPEVEGMQSDE